jgi:hypothetical protein
MEDRHDRTSTVVLVEHWHLARTSMAIRQSPMMSSIGRRGADRRTLKGDGLRNPAAKRHKLAGEPAN